MLTYFCVWKIKDYDHPGWWLFCQCLGTNQDITFMCVHLYKLSKLLKDSVQVPYLSICLESTSEFDLPIYYFFFQIF